MPISFFHLLAIGFYTHKISVIAYMTASPRVTSSMPLFVSSVCSAPSLCALFDCPRPDTWAAVVEQQCCRLTLGVSHRSLHLPSDLVGEQM